MTPVLTSHGQTDGAPNKAREIDAEPLLHCSNPNSNDLAGCRACLIGGNVANAITATTVAKTSRM